VPYEQPSCLKEPDRETREGADTIPSALAHETGSGHTLERKPGLRDEPLFETSGRPYEQDGSLRPPGPDLSRQGDARINVAARFAGCDHVRSFSAIVGPRSGGGKWVRGRGGDV
jgi:hypothetical protein